jgi:glycosyltransferase involved in cell wall biosynthesis
MRRHAEVGTNAAEAFSVLITVPWAQRLGGAEEMLCTFLDHIDRKRLRPHVVLLADGPLVEYLRDRDIPTTVIEAGRLRQVHLGARSIYRLARLIARERPDVILNWTTKSHAYTAVAGILARRSDRLVWWQHGIPQRDPLDRLAAAFPAVAIGCSSEAVAAAQREVAPRRRTVVVHPGIRPPTDARSTGSVRKQLGIAPDTRLLGVVGRVHPMKGQDLFVRALKLLIDEQRDVHGLIVGGDAYGLAPEYGTGLRRLIDELGLQHRVTLTGHVPDATAYIAGLDVLVSTSTAEPFGIVLLEAMQLGIPVVSTRLGGPAEILEDGVSGLLVGTRTPDAVADALRRLLDDSEAAASIGRAGRELVEREFTAEAMSSRIEALLREASQLPRPTSCGRTSADAYQSSVG